MAEQLRQPYQVVAIVSQELMRHRVPEQVGMQLHADQGSVFVAQRTEKEKVSGPFNIGT
jgi:hypothetical protein